MKHLTAAAFGALGLALAVASLDAHADSGARIRIAGVPLGSGLPTAGQTPLDVYAEPVGDGDFHVPGMLPGHPTAATLYPHEVRVPCKRDEALGELRCGGYDVSPMRGEYVYVRPVLIVAPPPPPPPPAVVRPPPPPLPPIRKKPLG